MKKYICKICGYIHEDKELNDEFFCPKCGVDKSQFEEIIEETKRIPISMDNCAIERTENKCINCGMCYKTCRECVGIKYNLDEVDSPICVNCGQCKLTCPTGAIHERYVYNIIRDFIKDTNKTVVVLTSPAVRVSLGEEFNLEPGTFVEGKMVSALKTLGFDYVFDTTFGADITTVEEATELIERIKSGENLPMFSSCCPAWVKYMEMYHPSKLNHLSTCKSPISMQVALIKNYFSKIKNINKEDIITVALTPCTAKKYEASREEIDDLDYVITTSELSLFIKEEGIDFVDLKDEQYDNIFGKGSGAGTIFGATGGVTESVSRTLYHFITGKETTKDFFKLTDARGLDGVKSASFEINGRIYKVAIINGLFNVFPILEKLENGEKIEYDFIEVMNCKGGCAGGGGQPVSVISKLDEVRNLRINGLYKNDEESNVRCSYQNEDVIRIYKEYLLHYSSSLAHELLHTTYNDKSYLTK